MIKQAHLADIDLIAPLFDTYRVFYKQESDIVKGSAFLQERFEKGENVIFFALHEGEPAGFTQLYLTFSSVSLQPFYILNDLFVAPKFRGQGIGEALLEHAKSFCKLKNYKGLALETATDNPAQRLYERLGWEKDEDYFHYFWKNKQ